MTEPERDEGKVLLLGGPFNFRTVGVKPGMPQILLALPDERPLSIDPYEPMSLDLRVARYTLGPPLMWRGELVGVIYEYEETR